jgi:hypothetical protein
MMEPRMTKRALLAAIAALAPRPGDIRRVGNPARYPSRPVEFVVPFAAGDSADVIARMVAQAVSQHWQQPIVVQDKPGATGAVASEYVAHAAADRYTLLLSTASTHTVLTAYSSRSDLRHDQEFRAGDKPAEFLQFMTTDRALGKSRQGGPSFGGEAIAASSALVVAGSRVHRPLIEGESTQPDNFDLAEGFS